MIGQESPVKLRCDGGSMSKRQEADINTIEDHGKDNLKSFR
ncbi:hypothetical protein [Microcystis aeruginosa]|nr:hypothetical protein [Microcystis aeruginosa]